jgi:hypothetical protein
VFSQLQGNSQSIPAAGLFAAPTSMKASMKGARRRMAKAKHRMQQPGYVSGPWAQHISMCGMTSSDSHLSNVFGPGRGACLKLRLLLVKAHVLFQSYSMVLMQHTN